MREKNKGTIKCDKRIVICDVGTAQYEDETSKCEKKKREPLNVTKKLSHVMLKMHNMRMKPSNVRKKIRKPSKVTKELSYVMLELHNVNMKSLNVRKNKGTIKCDKRIVTCDIGAVQCEDEIVKYEKKKEENHQI